MNKIYMNVSDIDIPINEKFVLKIKNIDSLSIWVSIEGNNDVMRIRRPKHSEWDKFNELTFDEKLISARVLVTKKPYGKDKEYTRLSFVDMKIEYRNKKESDIIDRDKAKIIVDGLNRVQKEFLLSYIANDIMSNITGNKGKIDEKCNGTD